MWKSNTPKRINVPIWIMPNESLNCSSVLRSKLWLHYISPSICVVRYIWWQGKTFSISSLNAIILFIARRMNQRISKFSLVILSTFHLLWVFGNSFKDDVIQVQYGASLKSMSQNIMVKCGQSITTWNLVWKKSKSFQNWTSSMDRKFWSSKT